MAHARRPTRRAARLNDVSPYHSTGHLSVCHLAPPTMRDTSDIPPRPRGVTRHVQERCSRRQACALEVAAAQPLPQLLEGLQLPQCLQVELDLDLLRQASPGARGTRAVRVGRSYRVREARGAQVGPQPRGPCDGGAGGRGRAHLFSGRAAAQAVEHPLVRRRLGDMQLRGVDGEAAHLQPVAHGYLGHRDRPHALVLEEACATRDRGSSGGAGAVRGVLSPGAHLMRAACPPSPPPCPGLCCRQWPARSHAAPAPTRRPAVEDRPLRGELEGRRVEWGPGARRTLMR